MPLFLVQHGKQTPKDQDPEQHLSEQGKEDVARIAGTAKGYNVKVSRIEHSGKARARETAEVFAQALDPEKGVGQREGIKATDDVKPLKDQVKPGDNLMLVGHLPFMEKLASHLITGNEGPPVIKFQNGGIVCLDSYPDTENWCIKWTLMPRIE